MRPFIIRPLIIALVSLFFLCVISSSTQAQNRVETVLITQIQADDTFPVVQVDFRPFDSSNNIIRNLEKSAISVFENSTAISQFEVDNQDRAPIFVVFVIDQGQYFQYQRIGENVLRQSLTFLTDRNYFRDGYDTVAILIREVVDNKDITTTWLGPTQSVSQFTNAVNRLQFTKTGRTDGLAGIETGIGVLSDLSPVGVASTSVIYLGSIIDDVRGQDNAVIRAQALGGTAHDRKIKLHVLHVETKDEFRPPFTALTQNSGGQYLRLSTGDNSLNLTPIYQDLVDQAQVYTLRYRSPSSTSGTRNVVVAPADIPLDAVADTAVSYSITVETPGVNISLPGTAIDRRGDRDPDTQSPIYREDTVDIEVSITWTQNPPRQITSASLVVNNIPKTEIQPEVDSNNRFKIIWDLTDFEDETQTIPIQVRIQDELGMEATSAAVQVTVNATLPPISPTLTPAPPDVAPPDPCLSNRFAPGCPIANLLNLVVTPILSITVIVLVVLLFINRNRVGQVARDARVVVRNQVSNVERTLIGGGRRKNQKTLARLSILVARRELIDTEVDIHSNRTRLGRNPKLCDIQLMNEDDISTVSGLHCTIQYDPQKNIFLITDDNSSNGTFVNGSLLAANEPHTLQDGDEIVMGELARRGAKVRFSVVKAVTVQAQDDSPSSMNPIQTDGEPTSNVTIVDTGNLGSNPELTIHDIQPLPPRPKNVDDSWLNDL